MALVTFVFLCLFLLALVGFQFRSVSGNLQPKS